MRVLFEERDVVKDLIPSSIPGGAEADLWEAPGEPLLAKIYRNGADEREEKLNYVVANPVWDPVTPDGWCAYAWPRELLRDPDSGRLLGYVMHRLCGGKGGREVWNPAADAFAPFAIRLRAAEDYARAVARLHAAGFVVGDINAENLLIDPRTGRAAAVDIDSIQVRLPDGRVLRCVVGVPEFTPAELQSVRFADVDRTPAHDNFGLAVIIFQLLASYHPFDGVYLGQGPVPLVPERIRRGLWPYGGAGPVGPPPLALPLAAHPVPVQRLFCRAFEQGFREIDARPGAEEWARTLEDYRRYLTTRPGRARRLYYLFLPAVRRLKSRAGIARAAALVLSGAARWPAAVGRSLVRPFTARRLGWGLVLALLLVAATVGWTHYYREPLPSKPSPPPPKGLPAPALWRELSPTQRSRPETDSGGRGSRAERGRP